MQVDQKPSPWPCVVMLVGLLACCLSVPIYWRPSRIPDPDGPPVADALGTRPDPGLTSAAANPTHRASASLPAMMPSFGIGLDNAILHPPARPVGGNSWVSLCPPPTLEELIAKYPGSSSATSAKQRLAASSKR